MYKELIPSPNRSRGPSPDYKDIIPSDHESSENHRYKDIVPSPRTSPPLDEDGYATLDEIYGTQSRRGTKRDPSPKTKLLEHSDIDEYGYSSLDELDDVEPSRSLHISKTPNSPRSPKSSKSPRPKSRSPKPPRSKSPLPPKSRSPKPSNTKSPKPPKSPKASKKSPNQSRSEVDEEGYTTIDELYGTEPKNKSEESPKGAKRDPSPNNTSPQFDILQSTYDDQMKKGKKLRAEKKVLRRFRKGKGETAAIKKNLDKRRSQLGDPRIQNERDDEGWRKSWKVSRDHGPILFSVEN